MLQINKMNYSYAELKSEVALKAEINNSIEDVITLDVNRSLHLH
jgi:hypothetical protein